MDDGQKTDIKPEVTSTQTDGSEEQLVSISQEKLNSLINGKFASGADKATKDLLSSIGVDDVDVLKSIVTAHKNNEEASKSELQKMQEASKSELLKMQELIEAERKLNQDLESKLATTVTEAEIQSLAILHGINPEKMKYFKMDFLEAKEQEGFEVDTFISGLKEKQPDFFGAINERQRQNLPNPKSNGTPASQIKMSDYAKLPASERSKYKASDIIR